MRAEEKSARDETRRSSLPFSRPRRGSDWPQSSLKRAATPPPRGQTGRSRLFWHGPGSSHSKTPKRLWPSLQQLQLIAYSRLERTRQCSMLIILPARSNHLYYCTVLNWQQNTHTQVSSKKCQLDFICYFDLIRFSASPKWDKCCLSERWKTRLAASASTSTLRPLRQHRPFGPSKPQTFPSRPSLAAAAAADQHRIIIMASISSNPRHPNRPTANPTTASSTLVSHLENWLVDGILI